MSTPSTTRIETQRPIAGSAGPDRSPCSATPSGHVAIDSSGMLQGASGEPVTAVGDQFTVHMDRESLNDFPELGKYDVTVTIREFEQDSLISWTVLGRIRPPARPRLRLPAGSRSRTAALSSPAFYDWSDIAPRVARLRHLPGAVREMPCAATLGILDRTVRRGYPRD